MDNKTLIVEVWKLLKRAYMCDPRKEYSLYDIRGELVQKHGVDPWQVDKAIGAITSHKVAMVKPSKRARDKMVIERMNLLECAPIRPAMVQA